MASVVVTGTCDGTSGISGPSMLRACARGETARGIEFRDDLAIRREGFLALECEPRLRARLHDALEQRPHARRHGPRMAIDVRVANDVAAGNMDLHDGIERNLFEVTFRRLAEVILIAHEIRDVEDEFASRTSDEFGCELSGRDLGIGEGKRRRTILSANGTFVFARTRATLCVSISSASRVRGTGAR